MDFRDNSPPLYVEKSMLLGRGLRRRGDNVRAVGEVAVVLGACFGGTGLAVLTGQRGLGMRCRIYRACRLCRGLFRRVASSPSQGKVLRRCLLATEGARTFVDVVMQNRNSKSVQIRQDHRRKQTIRHPPTTNTNRRWRTRNTRNDDARE